MNERNLFLLQGVAIMDIWIGTSGYSYPEWVGDFYPAGTRAQQMLPCYCRHFPLVELNFTFYRPPTAAMLAKQADQTPPGFQFLVKLPRTISHEQRPDDVPGFRDAVDVLRRRGQLLGVLCQLPQATHNKPNARRWLENLIDDLSGLNLAVEFRHRSWARAEVAPWLAELGVELVSVDVPELPGLFPRGLVRSTDTAYVRLHSRHADNWYQAGATRYDYDYSDSELGEWVGDVEEEARRAGAGRFLFLFNNCAGGLAAHNARRLRELLRRALPQAHLVEPFAEAAPVQGTLFE
jgi:uncharacterized protein YecE (DUF72 family)